MNAPRPEPKSPISWMASNSVAANLLMITLLIGGLFMAFQVQKEVFPNFELDVIEVDVSYPGSSPEEVEHGILQPVENAIRGVQGIQEMTSSAWEGRGRISLELVSGTDRMKAFQDVDQAVNRIRTFPADAEDPEVRINSRVREVMEVVLYGDIDIWHLRKLGEQVRDRLLNETGITQVELGRVPDYITHIEVPPTELRRYNLTLSEIADSIEQAGKDIPGGSIDTSQGEILIRLQARKQWADELESIAVLRDAFGGIVRLGEIAEIRDGFDETQFHSQFNRQPSIEIEIYRVGQQSPLSVARAVQNVLYELPQTLPSGVKYRVDNNSAEDFRDRLMLLLENGALAMLIVLVILGAFLQARLAFWIMMGMTVSFVAGVLFLPMVGVSLNMISMFAFMVVLGIVVDDAIVVGENIYEFRQQGLSRLDAAIQGVTDIATPVTFTILTTIVAFIPVMFIPGPMGSFWWPFPVVVIVVLLLSLFEALFILPAHLAHSHYSVERKSQGLRKLQQTFADSTNDFIRKRYAPFIKLCTRHRYVSISVALATLIIAGSYAASGHLGMIMMPRVAADEIEAGVRLPVGTTLDKSAKVADAITASTYDMFNKHDLHKAAEGIKTNVRGKNFIDVEIVMLPPDQRKISSAEVIRLWSEELGEIEGVEQITFEAERGPGGWRDDISVDLSHDNPKQLAQASQALKDRMSEFANARNINDSHSKGKLQISFQLKPEAEFLGLSPEYVGRQIREAFYGAVALRQLRGTNEVEVRVKLPKPQRQQLSTLETLRVLTPAGIEVPLFEIAEVELEESYSALNRRNGRRIVNVGMDIEPQSAINTVSAAMKSDVLPQLRAEYPGLTWSSRGNEAQMRESTQALWGGFALAMFVIYSLLAVAFKSYSQPFVVLIAVPFGAIGVVIGHLLLGYDLSIVSLMGTVALSGVVVNGALIMVDYANKKSTEMPPTEAIVEASVRRFRPIALTTMTTFGGLSPIILEDSLQAAQLIPMAIALGFGILISSAVVLIIVPCFYLMIIDLKTLLTTKQSL